VSAIKARFLGKRELFEAAAGRPELAIAGLEGDWKPRPVFHIDLTGVPYDNLQSLDAVLDDNLKPLEALWGREGEREMPSLRFSGLIRRACERSGRQVAVLVDEYDKPLLETMDDPEHRAVEGRGKLIRKTTRGRLSAIL
jgi:hypothetical protein